MKPPISKRKRALRLVCALLIAALGIYQFRFAPAPSVGGGKPDSWFATRLKNATYASVSFVDEQEHARLTPENSNGWQSVYATPIQNFEIYQSQNPTRPTNARRTLVLQPLGFVDETDRQFIEDLRAYTEAFFQLPTRVAPPLSLDEMKDATRAGQAGKQQFNASAILERVLKSRLPPDAAAYLGVTREDLWAGEMSFVFGLGSFDERVGVYSLSRYRAKSLNPKRRESGRALELRRACQVLNHEAGHMFGFQHCVLYKCSMNGANSLADADQTPLEFCPVCERKLGWNIGFNREKRERELLHFYQQHGFVDEANRSAKRLRRRNENG